MRGLVLSLLVSLMAVPALAGGYSVELPTLTWPEPDQVTTSTKSCVMPLEGDAAACK